MRQEIRNEAAGLKALAYIVMAMAGASLMLLLTLYMLASTPQKYPQTIVPPSNAMLGLFFVVALLCLLGSVLWTRLRVGNIPTLSPAEFSQRIFVGIALANVSEVLGVIWFFLSRELSLAAPLLIAPAVVILLFVLPIVRKKVPTSAQGNREVQK